MKVRNRRKTEEIGLDMTSMIDIVFQLLIFFVMQFKVIELEGDFNIRMPAAGPSSGAPDEDIQEPYRITLKSNADGELSGIKLDSNPMESLAELHQAVIARATGGGASGDAEAEFDCDYDLKYANVVGAITAVSGKVGEDGQVIKLIEKIKFTPPKKK